MRKTAFRSPAGGFPHLGFLASESWETDTCTVKTSSLSCFPILSPTLPLSCADV